MVKLKVFLVSALSVLFLSLLLFQLAGDSPWGLKEKLLGTSHKNKQEYLLLENSPIDPLNIERTINLGNHRQLAHVYHPLDSVSGLAIIDYENNFLKWLPGGAILSRSFRPRSPGEYLSWFRFHTLDDTYGVSEFLVQYANPGTAGVHPFYLYSYDGSDFNLLLKLVEASNKVAIRDLDSKWPDEIVHTYSISGIGKLERDLLRYKDIWRLEDGKLVKVNHQFPQEYQELLDLYQLALTKKEWEPGASGYYPILQCLKEKAERTMAKEPAGIEECRELLKERYE